MGERTELGSPEGGVEAAAATRTAVKTVLGTRGRDEQDEKDVGVPQKQRSKSLTPTPRKSGRERETESPPPGPEVKEGPAVGAWTDGQGRPSPPWFVPGSGSGFPGPTDSGASRPGGHLASMRKPRPLPWQQAVAGATRVAPTLPEPSQVLLWATGCAGSHARLRPLPIQVLEKGKERARVSGIPAGTWDHGGVPFGRN